MQSSERIARRIVDEAMAKAAATNPDIARDLDARLDAREREAEERVKHVMANVGRAYGQMFRKLKAMGEGLTEGFAQEVNQ